MSDPQALTTNAFPQNTGLKAAVAVLSLVFFVFTALYVYFKKEGKATYAIVLVPGYGQKSLSQSALLQSLALLPSCRVAGAFRTGASGRMLPPIIDGDPANTLYALDFDENLWKNGDIKTVSEKLAAYIDLIPCDSLVLVGYSMGGIVCRQYLATVPENKSAKVKALISIASPHRGTYWADAAALSDSLLGGFLSGRLADKLQVSYGMNMVAQMKTGNGFMKGLDESYCSKKSLTQTLHISVIAKSPSGFPEGFDFLPEITDGDFIVSCSSQDMEGISCLPPAAKRRHVLQNRNHFDILESPELPGIIAGYF